MCLNCSYFYIIHRRAGQVGPSAAPRFLKYAALHGVVQFLTYGLSLYLTPFNGIWMASVLRALILVPASFGRRLSTAEYFYNTYIATVFDAHATEIEQYLQTLRLKFAELNEALQVLAEHALKRLAVGGLPALFALPTANPPTVVTGTVTRPDAPHDVSTFSYVDRRSQESFLPQSSDTFPAGRPFFEDASDRVNAVATSIVRNLDELQSSASHSLPDLPSQMHLRDPLQAAIRPAVLESPKAAFEDARALRRLFRQRAARSVANKAPT